MSAVGFGGGASRFGSRKSGGGGSASSGRSSRMDDTARDSHPGRGSSSGPRRRDASSSRAGAASSTAPRRRRARPSDASHPPSNARSSKILLPSGRSITLSAEDKVVGEIKALTHLLTRVAAARTSSPPAAARRSPQYPDRSRHTLRDETVAASRRGVETVSPPPRPRSRRQRGASASASSDSSDSRAGEKSITAAVAHMTRLEVQRQLEGVAPARRSVDTPAGGRSILSTASTLRASGAAATHLRAGTRLLDDFDSHHMGAASGGADSDSDEDDTPTQRVAQQASVVPRGDGGVSVSVCAAVNALAQEVHTMRDVIHALVHTQSAIATLPPPVRATPAGTDVLQALRARAGPVATSSPLSGGGAAVNRSPAMTVTPAGVRDVTPASAVRPAAVVHTPSTGTPSSPSSRAGDPVHTHAVCIADFNPEPGSASTLALLAGTRVCVLHPHASGWWYTRVCSSGEVGYTPATYLDVPVDSNANVCTFRVGDDTGTARTLHEPEPELRNSSDTVGVSARSPATLTDPIDWATLNHVASPQPSAGIASSTPASAPMNIPDVSSVLAHVSNLLQALSAGGSDAAAKQVAASPPSPASLAAPAAPIAVTSAPSSPDVVRRDVITSTPATSTFTATAPPQPRVRSSTQTSMAPPPPPATPSMAATPPPPPSAPASAPRAPATPSVRSSAVSRMSIVTLPPPPPDTPQVHGSDEEDDVPPPPLSPGGDSEVDDDGPPPPPPPPPAMFTPPPPPQADAAAPPPPPSATPAARAAPPPPPAPSMSTAELLQQAPARRIPPPAAAVASLPSFKASPAPLPPPPAAPQSSSLASPQRLTARATSAYDLPAMLPPPPAGPQAVTPLALHSPVATYGSPVANLVGAGAADDVSALIDAYVSDDDTARAPPVIPARNAMRAHAAAAPIAPASPFAAVHMSASAAYSAAHTFATRKGMPMQAAAGMPMPPMQAVRPGMYTQMATPPPPRYAMPPGAFPRGPVRPSMPYPVAGGMGARVMGMGYM